MNDTGLTVTRIAEDEACYTSRLVSCCSATKVKCPERRCNLIQLLFRSMLPTEADLLCTETMIRDMISGSR